MNKVSHTKKTLGLIGWLAFSKGLASVLGILFIL